MRILFFDLECSDLAASWGRILLCSFADLEGEVYTLRGDKRPHKKEDRPSLTRYLPGEETIDDSKLALAIRNEIEKEPTILVGWNSILFDQPFLNARLQVAGERPLRLPNWPAGGHLDLMYYSGGTSLRVGGRKLDTVTRFFGTTPKTPIDGTAWQRAATGERKAMDQVQKHCVADVLALRDLFPILVQNVSKFVLPMKYWWKHLPEMQVATNG